MGSAAGGGVGQRPARRAGCVYCGGKLIGPLACWSHLDLLKIDPYYAAARRP